MAINAAPAGLERAAIFAGVGAGQHEALGIERHARAFEPSGVRIGADEQEQVPGGPAHFFAGQRVLPVHRRQYAIGAFERIDFGPEGALRHWQAR